MERLQSEPVQLHGSNIECALVAGAIGGLVGLMIGPVATLLCASGAASIHWWVLRCRSPRPAARHQQPRIPREDEKGAQRDMRVAEMS